MVLEALGTKSDRGCRILKTTTPINMQITKFCLHCAKQFSVPKWRESAKFCSRDCSEKHPRSLPNAKCDHCGKNFHIKPSQLSRYSRTVGVFCSTACLAEGKRVAYEGQGNPNYKGKNTDTDGYRTQPPSARRSLHHTVKRVHQAVCCEALGISRIPSGHHIHHRDCNVINNTPSNLAVMTVSDHKWLHKQYGVATLWAFCRGHVSLETLVSWSDDKERAMRLLPLDVLMQATN